MKLSPITLAAVTLGLAAAIVVPNTVQAAPGTNPAKAPSGRMQKMADALGLTDAQKAQMKPILMSAMQQRKALQADTKLTPQAKMDKMKEIGKTSNKQMMAILTPTQREKLKAMRQQQRAAKGVKP